MRTHHPFLVFMLALAQAGSGQTNTWVQLSNSVPPRHDALGFSLNGKGYLLFGQSDDGDTLKTLYRYDPLSDVWTNMGQFPGDKRMGAIAFSVSGKTYVGMGSGPTGMLNDLWAYDPVANTWTARAALPAPGRTMASAFTIGALGYVSGGADNDGGYDDLWAYDPASNSWSARANAPAPGGGASTFVLNDVAYLIWADVGGGGLWRYDAAGDAWTQGASFEDYFFFENDGGSVAFACGDHGFVLDAGHFNGPQGTYYPNRLWEYDPASDSWSLRNYFPALPRENVAAFTIDGRAYITTGSHFDPTHTYDDGEGNQWQEDNVRYSLSETWVFDPRDCTGVFHGTTLPGTACNDGNALSYADALDHFCDCTGSAQPQANFHPDELDAGFQTGTGFNNAVRALAVQPDGKIIAAGDFTGFNGTPNNGIARLNADGTLDASFNGAFGGHALAVQSDGRILVGGAGIHRLMPDGSADPSFVPFGIGSQSVNAIVVRPDGRIVVGGGFIYEEEGGSLWEGLVQLMPDGSLDPGFVQQYLMNVQAIVPRPDGRIVVGWANNDQFAVNIRELDANGYEVDWFTSSVGFGFSEPVRALALRPEGGLVAGGEFTRYDNDHWVNDGRQRLHLAQFTEEGPYTDLDPYFDPASSTDGAIYALLAGPGGRILAGGDFSSYRNEPHNAIVQVTRYGYADAAFNSGTGFNGGVRCFALAPDGSVVVGGLFTSYNGTTCGHITRLRTPGPACMPTQLTTTADPVVSCGAQNLKFNGTSIIAATEVPGANKYQFRFTNIPGQPAYSRNIAFPSRSFTLIKWATTPLKAGRTYNVQVRASFDEGASWCPFGPSCTVRMSSTPLAPGMMRDADEAPLDEMVLQLWPNPSDGSGVRLQLSATSTLPDQVSLAIVDAGGRCILTRMIPTSGEFLDAHVEFDRSLTDGLYLIRVTAGEELFQERMIVAR